MNKLLTKKEVCELLGICEMTLNRYMKAGKLHYYKSGEFRSAGVRFEYAEIQKYLESLKK